MSEKYATTPKLERILIIKPSSLGDVVTTLPLLCDLRRAYSEARIDWLVAPAFSPLVEGHEALSNVILFDRKGLASWWYSPAAFARLNQLKRRLREAKYDCVIDAQGLFRSGYLASVTRAPIRVGFADAREGGAMFYTHTTAIKRNQALSVVRMRSLLEPLGISPGPVANFHVPIQPKAKEKMSRLVPPGAIGLIAGCRGPGKRWPIEGFGAVIDALPDRPFVLFGTPDERDLCTEVVAWCHRPVANLAGQTSLPEMVAGLARCALVIGNDTGPLHVAAALGVPVVGLYGPTNPQSVGPYNQLERVLKFAPGDQSPVVEKVVTMARQILTPTVNV